MTKRTECFVLAFVGLVMMFATIFIQLFSMDIERHTLNEYVLTDLGQWSWWSTLGIPFLVGIAYLGASIYGLYADISNRGAMILFGVCFIFGCVLSVVSGFGYLAAITTGMCLVLLSRRKRINAITH